MDKIKRRKKQKRKVQREKERRAEAARLAQEFKVHFKEQGLRTDFSDREIKKAYDKVEKETISHAVGTEMIVALWVVRKKLGYSNRRLCRVATMMMQRVNWVGENSRSIPELDEELIADAKLDCKEIWKEDKANVDIGVDHDERCKREVEYRKAPYVFPVFMHAIFYELFKNPISRPSKRLTEIAQAIAAGTKRAIEKGNIKGYINDLADCGFKIDMKGRFGGEDVTPDEYAKYVRMLAL